MTEALRTRRRFALASGVAALWGVVLLVAAALIPQDAGGSQQVLGWLAILGGPFLVLSACGPLVPAAFRTRRSSFIGVWGWVGLALVWLLSRIPAMVAGPVALVLVALVPAGPFYGAYAATRHPNSNPTKPA